MGKRCARPACEAPATAGYNFDGLARVVWIIPIPETSAQCAGLLCRRHADAMTPPRKWELRDMRPALPEHFAPAPSAPSRFIAPERITANPVPQAQPSIAAATARAELPAEPVGPYSPLLARAFRAAG